jgi:phosphoesterase RecJ-like protein
VTVDWQAAIELLDTDGPILLACHINPDADALGSSLALGLALRRKGKQAQVSFGSSEVVWEVPATLRFLPGLDLVIRPETALAGGVPAVLVTSDTGSLDRLGPLVPLADKADAVLVLDHHASNTRYGTHHLVDASAASTTALVGGLVTRLGVDLDRDIATCLYAGLVTDTGSFSYHATTPDVHRWAAELLAAGVDQERVSRELFDTRTMAAVRLTGEALARAVLEPDDHLVWTTVSHHHMVEAGVVLAEIEGVIDELRTVCEAEVAVVLKGLPAGGWAVSTRSKGAVDVGAVCVALGGGGHPFAAGFTAPEAAPEDVLARLRPLLRR